MGSIDRRRARYSAKIAAVLYETNAAWYLLPRAPLTIWRVIRVLLPSGGSIHEADLLSFGPVFVGARSWYRKIARDFRAVGRWGWVWSDGFGVPLDLRFYNNTATYWLYGVLGVRYYTALAMTSFLVATVAVHGLEGNWWAGLVLAFALAGSPLLIGAQAHFGKPEMLWWALFPMMLLAAWREYWFITGAVFSILAFVNFAVALHAGMTLLFLVAVFWPGSSSAALLALGMSLGLVKTFVRLLPFVRSGLLQRLFGEQADVVGAGERSIRTRLRGMFSPTHAIYACLYSTALLLITLTAPLGFHFAALGAAVLLVYLVGQNVFYINDPQSFWMWHLAVLLSMHALAPTFLGAAGLTLFAYIHPRILGFPVPNRTRDAPSCTWFRSLASQAGAAIARLHGFPFLSAVSHSRIAEPVVSLFAFVENGGRVLMETVSADRRAEGYVEFLSVCDDVLPSRCIEVFPDQYVRAFCTRLFAAHIAAFSSATPAKDVRKIARTVGAGYVLAYNPELTRELERAGFQRLAELNPMGLGLDVRRSLQIPENRLVLLRVPCSQPVITPEAEYRIEGSSLVWSAQSGESYDIRFQFDERFTAIQNEVELPVEALAVDEDPKVRFMKVRAKSDGAAILRFAQTRR